MTAEIIIAIGEYIIMPIAFSIAFIVYIWLRTKDDNE